MEEYQEKQKNKKRKTSFIDDSELEGLSDDVVIIDKKKEEEIEKKLQKFRKKHPIRYED